MGHVWLPQLRNKECEGHFDLWEGIPLYPPILYATIVEALHPNSHLSQPSAVPHHKGGINNILHLSSLLFPRKTFQAALHQPSPNVYLLFALLFVF